MFVMAEGAKGTKEDDGGGGEEGNEERVAEQGNR